jgi:hypothetical protein
MLIIFSIVISIVYPKKVMMIIFNFLFPNNYYQIQKVSFQISKYRYIYKIFFVYNIDEFLIFR